DFHVTGVQTCALPICRSLCMSDRFLRTPGPVGDQGQQPRYPGLQTTMPRQLTSHCCGPRKLDRTSWVSRIVSSFRDHPSGDTCKKVQVTSRLRVHSSLLKLFVDSLLCGYERRDHLGKWLLRVGVGQVANIVS